MDFEIWKAEISGFRKPRPKARKSKVSAEEFRAFARSHNAALDAAARRSDKRRGAPLGAKSKTRGKRKKARNDGSATG